MHIDLNHIIHCLWPILRSFLSRLRINYLCTKESLCNLPQSQKFIDHCCRKRHYSFEIRKCGSRDCNMCKPIRLTLEIFNQLKQLPDPMPGKDQHYLPFQDVFCHLTSEEHRPSRNRRKHFQSQQVYSILWIATRCWCAKNVKCVNCLKKLKPEHNRLLSLKFPLLVVLLFRILIFHLHSMRYRSLNCFDPIENLYFSADYEPICFYCTGQVKQEQSQATASGPAQRYYPQCVH